MVVSTHLENSSQIGSFPNFRDEYSKNIWNHDPPKSNTFPKVETYQFTLPPFDA